MLDGSIVTTRDGGVSWRVEATGPGYGRFTSGGETIWLLSYPDTPAFFSPSRIALWRSPIRGAGIAPPDTGSGGGASDGRASATALALASAGVLALALGLAVRHPNSY